MSELVATPPSSAPSIDAPAFVPAAGAPVLTPVDPTAVIPGVNAPVPDDAVPAPQMEAPVAPDPAGTDPPPPVAPPAITESLQASLDKLTLKKNALKQNASDRLRVIQADGSNNRLSSLKEFKDMNLPPHLLSGIYSMGFTKPSNIQEDSLPRILHDPPMNLIAQAQSGSGKTAAFVIGMLYRITIDSPATTQAVCVSPTRELAVQVVSECLVPMSSHMEGLRTRMALAREMIPPGQGVDAHIVVGTPGKVKDWMTPRRGRGRGAAAQPPLLDASTVKIFVLDEADEMCNENGLRGDTVDIKAKLPPNVQSLFFSATFPSEVLAYAGSLVGSCDRILIDSDESLILDEIKQLWVDTEQYGGGKLQFLQDIYQLITIGQSIVFVETKQGCNMVAQTLNAVGYSCSPLHGDLEPHERDGLMRSFREGSTKVLITTNVLARGVDINEVSMVINYDMPQKRDRATRTVSPDCEAYLHRIGRTGRFGRKGTAINLVQDHQSKMMLAAIENHFLPGREMIQQADPNDIESLCELVSIE